MLELSLVLCHILSVYLLAQGPIVSELVVINCCNTAIDEDESCLLTNKLRPGYCIELYKQPCEGNATRIVQYARFVPQVTIGNHLGIEIVSELVSY